MKFVEVPAELYSVFGKPEEGTRMHFKAGAHEEIAAWSDAVYELAGRTVSPGGVSGFVPVGRAAVHKRLKEGRLTGFFFETTHRKRSLFGTSKEIRTLDIALIPVSECKQWADEIKGIALAKGIVTQEELEGDKPDWTGEFLQWKNREAKRKALAAKKESK